MRQTRTAAPSFSSDSLAPPKVQNGITEQDAAGLAWAASLQVLL